MQFLAHAPSGSIVQVYGLQVTCEWYYVPVSSTAIDRQCSTVVVMKINTDVWYYAVF